MAGDTRVRALDGMRALAVLAVFGSHAHPWLSGGWVGVEVFFVLSGFLITTLLLAEHDRTGQLALRRFYVRRALRLYPALLATLLLVAPLLIWFDADTGMDGVRDYLGAAAIAGTYLQDFANGLFGYEGPVPHTWSLAVEEQFYLAWPLVLMIALRRRWNLARGLALVVVLGFAALFMHPGDPDRWNHLPWTHAPVLLAGCLLAVVLRRRRPTASGAAANLLAAGGIATIVGVTLAGHFLTRADYLVPILIAITVATVATIYGVQAAPGGAVSRLLSVRPLAWLGLISYGFYLIHLPVIFLVDDLDLRRSVIPVVALVVTIGLAALSYRLIELPFLRLKSRWESPGERGALLPQHVSVRP